MQNPDPSHNSSESIPIEEGEEQVSKTELLVEFRKLSGHLLNLYSDQCHLPSLADEAAIRCPKVLLSPEQSYCIDSEINVSPPSSDQTIVPVKLSNNPEYNDDPDAKWERILEVPTSVNLPPTQTRCTSGHWSNLADLAIILEDALLELTLFHDYQSAEEYLSPADTMETEITNPEDDIEKLEAQISRRIALADEHLKTTCKDKNPDADSFYLNQLQRDLSGLVRLTRCAASLCFTFGDFNAASSNVNEQDVNDEGEKERRTSKIFDALSVSRATIWTGVSLRKRADDIEASSNFLLCHIEQHPGIAPNVKDIKEINQFCLKVRQDKQGRVRHFTPKEIGLYFLERGEMTVHRTVKTMENDKDENFKAQSGHQLYTWKEGMQILFYYLNQPGHHRVKKK